MLVDFNPWKKYVDIWLAHGEEPPDLRGYRFQGYQTVIWRSGDGNLAELTADLIRHNMDLPEGEGAARQLKTGYRER